MSESLLASMRAALNPLQTSDWPQLFGAARVREDWDADCALSAARIGVKIGGFSLEARRVRFRRGAVTAVIGPNGAGKTTLLEALLGFRSGAGERLRILDTPAERFMRDRAALRRLGAQLQKVEYPDHVKVDEIIALHRAMYRVQDANVDAALGMRELIGKPYRGLSKGQRQRVDLYVALAHRPDLAVLDEPFTGLDRHYTRVVIDLLQARPGHASVAMICHSGEELASVDDVIWVADGGVRYQGPLAALKAERVGDARAVVHCLTDSEAAELRQRIAALPCALDVRIAQPLQIEAFGDATLHASVQTLLQDQPIRHVELAPSGYGDLLRVCAKGEAHE
jgi:ABC-2 type transport system ATP-binding protein